MKEIKIYEIPNIDSIERIDDPYIGMIFYVSDIDTYYSVKTLKEINGINMKGSKVVEYVIDEYANFGTGSGGGSGLTSTQLANIAKIPAIQSTVDALPNNYASKAHNHSEYASSSHRHDASEIDNLPSGGGVSQEDINTAVNNYLTEHPVQSGATAEQAAQIEANRIAIGDANSGLKKEVNDIKNTELQNLNTAIQTLETLVGVDETVGDKTGLPSGDENIIASINRIDNKTASGGAGLTLRDVNYNESFMVDDGGTTYINTVISNTNLTLLEGNNDTITIALDSAPETELIVTLSVNNSNISLDKTQLTFTTDNYASAQSVIITATHDESSYNDKTSQITLSGDNLQSNIINITIQNIDSEPAVSVTGVSLNTTNADLYVGDSINLVASVLPSNATNKTVTFSIDNENCSLTQDGLNVAVKGLVVGSSIVTVTTEDGSYTAQCTINVAEKTVDTTARAYMEGDYIYIDPTSITAFSPNVRTSNDTYHTYFLLNNSTFNNALGVTPSENNASTYHNSEITYYNGTTNLNTFVEGNYETDDFAYAYTTSGMCYRIPTATYTENESDAFKALYSLKNRIPYLTSNLTSLVITNEIVNSMTKITKKNTLSADVFYDGYITLNTSVTGVAKNITNGFSNLSGYFTDYTSNLPSDKVLFYINAAGTRLNYVIPKTLIEIDNIETIKNYLLSNKLTFYYQA